MTFLKNTRALQRRSKLIVGLVFGATCLAVPGMAQLTYSNTNQGVSFQVGLTAGQSLSAFFSQSQSSVLSQDFSATAGGSYTGLNDGGEPDSYSGSGQAAISTHLGADSLTGTFGVGGSTTGNPGYPYYSALSVADAGFNTDFEVGTSGNYEVGANEFVPSASFPPYGSGAIAFNVLLEDLTAGIVLYQKNLQTDVQTGNLGSLDSFFTLTAGDKYYLAVSQGTDPGVSLNTPATVTESLSATVSFFVKSPSAVPEPSSLAILVSGLAIVGARRTRA